MECFLRDGVGDGVGDSVGDGVGDGVEVSCKTINWSAFGYDLGFSILVGQLN